VAAGKKTNEQQHSECKLHLPKEPAKISPVKSTKSGLANLKCPLLKQI